MSEIISAPKVHHCRPGWELSEPHPPMSWHLLDDHQGEEPDPATFVRSYGLKWCSIGDVWVCDCGKGYVAIRAEYAGQMYPDWRPERRRERNRRLRGGHR